MYEEKTREIENLIKSCLEGRGIDLVEIHLYRHRGVRSILRILVDKPEGGISLDECAILNEEISQALDNSNVFLESYILEVSSPGLDRPLATHKDFLRAIDRKIRVILSKVIGGKAELAGVLKRADENNIYLIIDNEELGIPLESISKARHVI